MAEAGMNILRFNFSHGDYDYHRNGMEMIKKVREDLGLSIGILMDTKGPEVRTGSEGAEKIELVKGEQVILTTRPSPNSKESLYIDCPGFCEKMSIGSSIRIDDGLLAVKVIEKDYDSLTCAIMMGGTIKPRRGVNVPGISLDLEFLSEKDKRDLAFGAEMDVDIVASSFVRTADDIRELRGYLYKNCDHFTCDIVAKIENHEGVENLDEICFVADGIMVARGDLGVELPVETVPIIQKNIIENW